ncbi:RNA-directed DNA polymerase from mobile element jockey [Trichonephila clavipes]|nr:RNA-directed DNA polymerase from mobile element jockey [Trichonephila clavipes]
MPLIYLQLVNDAKADTIFQFTEMFGTQISFERYDNSRNKRPNQCWRCRGFSILRKSAISQLNALNAQGLTRLKTIANDEGVDEELLARAFRAALPALRKLSHPDDKAYVTLKNGQTKLEPGQDPLIANYHLYKDDRVIFPRIRTAGGTAIYCKSNFVQSKAPLAGIQYMDATAIEIKINNFPPLRVVSAYARFCAEINRKFPEKDFLKILNSGNNLIIAGELNAAHKTWHNTRSNNFGFRLKRIIQNYPNARIVAPYTPTHINSRSRPGNFRFLLKNKPLPIPVSSSNEHLDVAIGRLLENISEALVAASKPKFKTSPIKLPPDIRSKIRHRNRVRRFWQRSRDPALKNELRTISNEISSDIRHLSRARWEKTIEELSPETGTLWRHTSFLKKPFHHIPPKGHAWQYRSCPD